MPFKDAETRMPLCLPASEPFGAKQSASGLGSRSPMVFLDPCSLLGARLAPCRPPAIRFTGSTAPWHFATMLLKAQALLGVQVKARVTGARPFECLAVVSLKESVVARGVGGLEGVVPGGLVQGTVVSVEESGLRVSLGATLKCVAPTRHSCSNLAVRGLPPLTLTQYRTPCCKRPLS